ncbi:MAG TPA: U32 family peptidase [Spirochaetota bacterium]|nr:U32 family peptidase [Spirochaetota bacterium]
MFCNDKKIPCLLAPGGDYDAVIAAFVAGADEVYCGVDRFNARRRASNITLAQLNKLASMARRSDRHIYLTINTLCVQNEINDIIELIGHALNSGVHGLIIQDYGLLYIVRTLFPDAVIHASTQMTTLNKGQIEFLSECGVSRVNLSRELDIDTIEELTLFTHSLGMQTEVFVHGAYCISYSGQCYMSSFMGGQSGNRGICFQPCRRSYQIAEERKNIYPLSLKDNSAFAFAKQLSDAGVDSLKIEGRIKGFMYVYNTVSAWRGQLDKIEKGQPLLEDDRRLHSVFNRGFSAGYLLGEVSSDMFTNRQADQSLRFAGTVTTYHADKKIITISSERSGCKIKSGDRVLLYSSENRFICTGIIGNQTGDLSYGFTIENELKDKINRGQLVYISGGQPEREKVLNIINSFEAPLKNLSVTISGKKGDVLKAKWLCEGREFNCATDDILEEAKSISLGEEVLQKQLSKLSDSGFVLKIIDVSALDPGLYIALSQLNMLRRKALNFFLGYKEYNGLDLKIPNKKNKIRREGNVSYLINSHDHYDIIRESGLPFGNIYFEVTDPGVYYNNDDIIPWFPSVISQKNMNDYVSLIDSLPNNARVVINSSSLVSNIRKRGLKWIAGPYFNITNSMALELFANYDSCFDGGFVSMELNREQINDLAYETDHPLYMMIFGPLLLMSTRQCLIRQAAGCSKQYVDSICFKTCSKNIAIENQNGDKYNLVKRQFMPQEMYNGAYLSIPEAIKEIDNIDFCVDIREIPSIGYSNDIRKKIVNTLSRKLRNLELSEIKTTSGNYRRGLS